MSNRTIVELNHDCAPRDNALDLIVWALRVRYYMGNADSAYLPNGVTFLHYRHHSEPSPLPVPARRALAPVGYPTWIREHAAKLIANFKVPSDGSAEEM